MSEKGKKKSFVIRVSNWGYLLGCAMLYLIAFWIILGTIWTIASDLFLTDTFSTYNLLDEVALIVFSIALIDVAKYLLIEEVITGILTKHPPKEARRTLTKFVIIIATALSLKGLVLAIEVAVSDIQKMIYPIMLLLTGTFMIIGLGVYQKLNASAEDGE